MFTHSYS